MTNTTTTHARAIARSFGKDTAAVAARVRALYAAHSDGLTGGKSLTELAAAATDERIRMALGEVSAADLPNLRTDDRYRVSKSTLGTYSLAASLIRDMGLAPSDLDDSDMHAVYRTTANRAGITEFRADAVAAVLAQPATDRAASVFGIFDRAYTEYRDAQRVPAPAGKPDTTVDTTPTADVADVEDRMTAADVAMVPPSADVIVAAIERAVLDAANLSDADALRVFDALDTAWQTIAPRIDALTGATV